MKQNSSRLMPRKSIILAAGAALSMLSLVAHPDVADARAGGGMSMGSRGSRTYSAPAPSQTAPFGATPFQRTMTPRQQTPAYGARAPFGAGAGMAMARPRHPFMSGFMGGLIGAGLFGMMFGHGMFNSGMGGGGFLGLLIQLALVFFLVRWAIRRFSNRGGGTAGGPVASPFGAAGSAGPQQGGPQNTGVAITSADYQAFQQALINIQTAWSQQNVDAMRHMATPEMVSYFNNQLTELASRGARNVVSDLRFERGDLVESWRENGADYATVAMQYSMIDITTDMTGRVIEGDPSNRTTVTELWTFVRAAGLGTWLLSAIQQTPRR